MGMTYEQSLKNIETLKNRIRPWDIDYIFFDFQTETEFKVIFLIRTSSNQEVLYYEDVNIRYEYNLTMQKVLKNDFKHFKRRCSAQLKLDMSK